MTKSEKLLGQRLKTLRLDRLWTQKQAAAIFGVSIATYIRVETGRGCLDLTRAKIEKVLALHQQTQAVA
jgi:transcriptional regulator with XRE-family HTH domain